MTHRACVSLAHIIPNEFAVIRETVSPSAYFLGGCVVGVAAALEIDPHVFLPLCAPVRRFVEKRAT